MHNVNEMRTRNVDDLQECSGQWVVQINEPLGVELALHNSRKLAYITNEVLRVLLLSRRNKMSATLVVKFFTEILPWHQHRPTLSNLLQWEHTESTLHYPLSSNAQLLKVEAPTEILFFTLLFIPSPYRLFYFKALLLELIH